MFSHTELSSGNCTKAIRDDILLLDQNKIQGIRGLSSGVKGDGPILFYNLLPVAAP